MMNKYPLILAFLSILFSISCKNNNNDALLPQVKGSANDVIVVMSDNYWDSKPGELMRTKFSEMFPSLPQAEPIFDILHTSHENFDNVYKRQRNIVIVQIGPEFKETTKIRKNLYAKPQLVLYISAPDKESFENYFLQVQDNIVRIIQDEERKRIMQLNIKGNEASISKMILDEHKIKLVVPVGFDISMDSTHFIWLSNEYKNINEEILIYYYPYTDTNDFSQEALIAKRNEIGKKFISGTAKGSYMITDDIYLKYREFAMDGGKYTVEMRGLWKLTGGKSMGGPFVSITQYDEKRQRIVTAEGFIFAPGEDKRNMINKIEAIIYSLDFPEE